MKNLELVEKWLEALESGRFKQAKGSLSYGHGDEDAAYCCLGVLCVVAKENKFRISDDVIKTHILLPRHISRFVDMDSGGEFVNSIQYRGKTYDNLACLNDDGVRFKTIARILRQQLKKGNIKAS